MNLIGSRPDGWWNDPDRAIHRLVGELDRYAAATRKAVVVVFDRRPPGFPDGPHGAVTVAFARWRGRNAADHEIVRMVAAHEAPASIRVVTSDRRLIERVQALGARTVSPTTFRSRLRTAGRGGPEPGAG
jgi:predicted RNA-binding protein with PIN domain